MAVRTRNLLQFPCGTTVATFFWFSGELKQIFGNFPFALVFPFLCQVIFVGKSKHQSDHVRFIRSFHPGNANQSERKLFGFAGGRLRHHLRLISAAAIVRDDDVAAIRRVRGNHVRLIGRLQPLHQRGAVGHQGVGNSHRPAAVAAFPLPHQSLELVERRHSGGRIVCASRSHRKKRREN